MTRTAAREGSGVTDTREDRTDVPQVTTVVHNEAASMGAWLGMFLGDVDGVLAVYYRRTAFPGAPSFYRVWTIPEQASDPRLRGDIGAQQALVARKFPEFRFEFRIEDRAAPEDPDAILAYRRE